MNGDKVAKKRDRQDRLVTKDQTVSDGVWWFSPYSEFEDFIDIGEDRVKSLARELKGRVSPYLINRLLKANGLPHGPTNTSEGPINGGC